MKKPLIWIASAALALVGTVILYSPIFTVDVPEARVRSEVAMRLPMTIEKNGVNIVVRSATVDFLDTNQVALSADADVAGYGLSGSAQADITSGLRYDAGDFYLSDLSVEDVAFNLDGASQKRLSDTGSVAGGLFQAARDRLDRVKPGVGDALDRLKGEAMSRVEPALRAAIDDALKTIPVYSLNGRDMKYDLAALALEDVSFSADAAHATLSPGKALSRILLAGFLMVLSAIGALVMIVPWINSGRR